MFFPHETNRQQLIEIRAEKYKVFYILKRLFKLLFHRNVKETRITGYYKEFHIATS